jgi:catechol 2,3-dioxygenase-like lactoylglutathione lyase family enzyme
VTQLLVNTDVDDLEEAARFYTEALALRVGRRFAAAGIELLGAEAPIYLLVKDAGTAPAARVHTARAVGHDIDPAVARARGCRPEA